MSSLDQELAALAAMSSAQLREEWQRVMRTAPPAFSPDLMERAIAYELQARRHGGLPPAVQRALDRVGRQLARAGKVSLPRETRLKPGTRLSRDWHGRTHHVLVIEEGYLFEERRYRSLSQVAAAITGTAWSGPRFFGLKPRQGGHGQG
jgi:hypothetical protein